VSPGIFVYTLGSINTLTVESLSPEALRIAVAGLGYELVDVRVAGSGSRQLLILRIDLVGGSSAGAGVTTEDCVKVSRALEAGLESAGVVGPSYTLEVSSPGIERPVRFIEHWRRYVGRDVSLKAKGVNGRPTATIRGVPDDENLDLVIGGEDRRIPLVAVKEATLVVDWSVYG
jgi:ribosome maturation factor RimP